MEKNLNISYGHEFISNRVRDELILHSIWNFEEVEASILEDFYKILNYDPGVNRNINTLSGGQRAILYLITLSHIKDDLGINRLNINLHRILESLTSENRLKIVDYLNSKGILVGESVDTK